MDKSTFIRRFNNGSMVTQHVNRIVQMQLQGRITLEEICNYHHHHQLDRNHRKSSRTSQILLRLSVVPGESLEDFQPQADSCSYVKVDVEG